MKHINQTFVVRTLLAVVMGAAGLATHADTKVRTSSFEYNAQGLLTKEVIEPDLPNSCLQTTYGYDAWGNKTTVSTQACAGASGYAIASASTARTASTSYGTDGRFPVSSSNGLGQSETKGFDAATGGVTSLLGPNGLTTTWEYDGFGRKKKELRSDGTYTAHTYKLCTDTGANCPSPIGGAAVQWVIIEQGYTAGNVAMGPEKRQFHDTLDRPVRVQTAGYDGAGAAPVLVQDTEYDSLGRVKRKSDTYALSSGTPMWSEYTYDVLGRVVQEQRPDPAASGGVAVTSMTYNGLVTSVTNAKGQTKTTTRNAQGQVAQVTDHQGHTVTYTYDALGQLTQTNAAGSITTMTYNQRGQKTAMVDPAMGSWAYAYNVYGELVWQRDSLGQQTSIDYDALGRITKRTEPDLVSEWSYDKKFDNTACGKGVGKLCEARSDNGYKRTHVYDTQGRISSTATVLDNPSSPATVSVAYDANTGRINSKTWPTGYQATYEYTALGYLKKVTGGGTGGFTQTVSYEVLAMNARGQITQYKQGNQVTTVRAYDASTGRLTGQTATTQGQTLGNVLSHTYTYDVLDNLTARTDNSPGVGTSETFAYDSLNRLNLYTILGGGVSPPQSTEVLYDARGNISYKSDVGRYWYDPQRPNRIANVTLETAPGATIAYIGTRALSYVFDDFKPNAQLNGGVSVGNGNLEYTVSQDIPNGRHTYRGETYTSFNMPNTITFGNMVNNAASTADRTLSFVYGPEHQRIKQAVVLTSNNPTSYSAGTTWYLNGEDNLGLAYEKEVKASGTTEHKHYVSAAGFTFAMFVSRTGTLNGAPATSTNYMHHDHLGSVAVISNALGAVIERMAYDPWGKRRFVNGMPDVMDSIVGVNVDRGYTMHEHLDEIGVIHMNGRVYDPLIGRFMSADPYIQSAYDLQSYNRYSYVSNNPLALTDPTGYFSLKKLFRAVAAIAVAYFTGTYIGGLEGAIAGGFAGGAVQTGTLKGALQGALTAGLFHGVGDLVPGKAGSWTKVAGHAAAGCVASAVAGGKCGSGALAAGFAEFAGPLAGNWGSTEMNTIKHAILGGIGAELGGGKFANGAVTGAFGYLFNQAAHEGWGQKGLESHFKDHGADFNAKTAVEYETMARDFWNRALATQGTEFRIDAYENVRIYDRATNTFAAFDKSGNPTTFFKPQQGDKYWDGVSAPVKKWGEKVDTTNTRNLTATGRALQILRILGRSTE